MADDTHTQLRETVRSFTERELVPHLDEWEANGLIPRSVTERAGELGLLGLRYPETVGGSGGDFLHLVALLEECLWSGGSIGATTALLTHEIVVPPLLAGGDPDQIQRWVRPALQGDKLCSFAVTEPDAGSDVASLSTRATRTRDGYVVNGSKMFISNAVRADFVLVAVRTGERGHRGISLLVVEKDTPGFEVGRTLDKMGWLCSDTAELTFRDCEVPEENLIGPENGGFGLIMATFMSERLIMATEAHAAAQRCLDLSIDYARTREAFGAPLTSLQVIRHKLAKMARLVEVARAYTRVIAKRHRDGEEGLGREAAIAKRTATLALDEVVDEAVQIHGGYGYIRDYEVERHYRDSRIMRIGGGTDEIMDEIISSRLLT